MLTAVSRSLFLRADAMTDDSNQLRLEMRHKRAALPTKQRLLAAQQIANLVQNTAAYRNSKHIAVYLAIKGEADPAPLAELAWKQHKKCYLPILKNGHLIFGNYTQTTKLTPNRYSILEPIAAKTTLIEPSQLDLVVVPLVAFDRNCNRIGMGGGFYDRTFEFIKTSPQPKPFLLGIGYELQQLEQITPNPWDVKLHMVVTEKQIYTV